MLSSLRNEMQTYYRDMRYDVLSQRAEPPPSHRDVEAHMAMFLQRYPDAAAVTIKAELHTCMAAAYDPVIFPHSPFFWEMGMRPSENWGTPGPFVPASWLLRQRSETTASHPHTAAIRALAREDEGVGLTAGTQSFDADHHCFGSTRLLRTGVDGLLDDIGRASATADAEGRVFLDAAATSCRAVICIAERFAAKAEAMLPTAADDDARHCLQQIAVAARRVPRLPPRTFYEGLAALWFLREVTASLEGIGISVIGHPDRQLVSLYRADIAAGRLSRDDARDLLARWMLPTDVKFAVDLRAWPETSTCLELGGCDADGSPVFNEITEMILQVHAANGLLNPKLNCRFSADSPDAYLEQLATVLATGHNCFAFLNDDVLIPACIRAGKTPAEARLYVNGGCQETIVEGVEHSAGAFYYFSLPRLLDLCLQPLDGLAKLPPAAAAALPDVIEKAETFASFYDHVMAALRTAIVTGAAWRREVGESWRDIHPCPFFSASLAGCLETGRDYTAGGARYNQATVAAVGFATMVDSLFAIRTAVYDEGWCDLNGLRTALAQDWAAHDMWRQRCIALPKFGHGNAAVDALAAEFATDLATMIEACVNERGGRYQPSLFVYYAFEWLAPYVRATPDGRRAGEWLSQGAGASRRRGPDSVTDLCRSIGRIDFTRFPGNAVVDLQLPMGQGLSPTSLASIIRTFGKLGGATIQPNMVSLAKLRDARRHPDQHRDLMVRICGLSARFVSLSPSVQDDIIGRHMYTA